MRIIGSLALLAALLAAYLQPSGLNIEHLGRALNALLRRVAYPVPLQPLI